jgi:hypothetical protein
MKLIMLFLLLILRTVAESTDLKRLNYITKRLKGFRISILEDQSCHIQNKSVLSPTVVTVVIIHIY